MTKEYYPYPIQLDSFERNILEGIAMYKKNMNNLSSMDNKVQHMEQWMESFLAWMEIESKND